VYPDLRADTGEYIPQEIMVKDYKVISYHNLYKPKIAVENLYLNRGDLYNQRNYLRTQNRYNAVGSWRLVAIDQIPRPGTDTVDFIVRLTPAEKYSLNANIEGSQNFGSNLFNGNFIGFNVGLQNRNFARAANLATTNFRFATEVLSGEFIRTRQVSFGNAIYFPRLIPRLGFIPQAWKENARSLFTFNMAYTSRKDFFDLASVNGAWGYEFNWKNKLLSIRLPNVEYTYLQRGDSLNALIDSNRSYAYIYNSGLVASIITNLTITGGKKDVSNVARFNLESSGLLTGLFKSKTLDENLHRFIKLDAEFRQTYKIRRSAFAWRAFAGAGYQLSSDRFRYDTTLPFFKSYVAGGANSMRAWALRKLGPGSTIKSFNKTIAPERYGDMQLELNAEYRFYITSIGSIQVNSAAFVDMGNIWTIRKLPDFPNGHFRINKLWTDMAVGAGTGLRLDFGFFLIRLDWAYKLKDPSPSPEHRDKVNKFFPYRDIGDGQLQLGVTYPF
jgi:outer membrane protein assembly factor BamA